MFMILFVVNGTQPSAANENMLICLLFTVRQTAFMAGI